MEVAGVLEQDAEVVADPRRGEVVSRQVAFRERQGPAVKLFGFVQLTGLATLAGEPLVLNDLAGGLVQATHGLRGGCVNTRFVSGL